LSILPRLVELLFQGHRFCRISAPCCMAGTSFVCAAVSMKSTRFIVEGPEGLRGQIDSPLPAEENARVTINLDSGQRITVPARVLQRRADNVLYLPLSGQDIAQAQELEVGQSVTIPVIEEQLDIQKQTHDTGSVVVHVTPHVRHQPVDVTLHEEHAEIERVPINRSVDHPTTMRQEGDVTIIPVFEEVLVVEKRLILKEEIHIRTTRTTRHEHQDIPLRTEQVQILRADQP
jgi:uncharacterized protein (TIGR02271 family)